MKYLVITHNLLPQPTGFGSAIHMWSVIHTMVQRGNDVHLLIYDVGQYDVQTGWKTEANQLLADQLSQLGVSLHVLPTQKESPARQSSLLQSGINVIRRLFDPSPVDYYAGPNYAGEVNQIIREFDPDVLFAYTFDATSLISNIKGRLRVSSVVDLDHFARKQRMVKIKPRTIKEHLVKVIDQILLWQMPGVMINIVKNCDLVIEHANHHKEWLVSNGVSNVIYLPVMVLDYARDRIGIPQADPTSTQKVKITLVGKLNGIATLTGIRLLAEKILPRIDESEIKDSLEIHIIGGGTLPEDIRSKLNQPYVSFRGYVDDIHTEFLSSDIILVPTPIDLGFRTRIAEAFSFGCCVVAHSANAAGMPELKHDDNVLLGDTGEELVTQIIRCVESAELRQRIGHSARSTFETEMSGDLVSKRLVEKIEAMIANRQEGFK